MAQASSAVMPKVVAIVVCTEEHFRGVHAALSIVAAEKKYLATTEAPTFDVSSGYYRGILATNFPFYVALRANKVVGWCDVSSVFGGSRRHIGVLGIALLPEYRHQGLGAKLMEAAIQHAWRQGLTRLTLTVRADNVNAKRLYERFGFVKEGLLRNESLVDGRYKDVVTMGLLNQTEA
jgi:ribosomal protein S18 acetylase RimI-like enzyme